MDGLGFQIKALERGRASAAGGSCRHRAHGTVPVGLPLVITKGETVRFRPVEFVHIRRFLAGAGGRRLGAPRVDRNNP